MNCRGCKDEMMMAYDCQCNGYNIAYIGYKHFTFIAFDDKGKMLVW